MYPLVLLWPAFLDGGTGLDFLSSPFADLGTVRKCPPITRRLEHQDLRFRRSFYIEGITDFGRRIGNHEMAGGDACFAIRVFETNVSITARTDVSEFDIREATQTARLDAFFGMPNFGMSAVGLVDFEGRIVFGFE